MKLVVIPHPRKRNDNCFLVSGDSGSADLGRTSFSYMNVNSIGLAIFVVFKLSMHFACQELANLSSISINNQDCHKKLIFGWLFQDIAFQRKSEELAPGAEIMSLVSSVSKVLFSTVKATRSSTNRNYEHTRYLYYSMTAYL